MSGQHYEDDENIIIVGILVTNSTMDLKIGNKKLLHPKTRPSEDIDCNHFDRSLKSFVSATFGTISV